MLFSVLYLNLKSILKNKKWWNNGITSWIWSLILALFSLHSISKMSTCQIQLSSQRISSLLSSQSIFKYILLQKSQSNITVLPCKRSFLFSIIFLKSFSVIPNISSFYQAFNLELIVRDTSLLHIKSHYFSRFPTAKCFVIIYKFRCSITTLPDISNTNQWKELWKKKKISQRNWHYTYKNKKQSSFCWTL